MNKSTKNSLKELGYDIAKGLFWYMPLTLSFAAVIYVGTLILLSSGSNLLFIALSGVLCIILATILEGWLEELYRYVRGRYRRSKAGVSEQGGWVYGS